MSQNYDRSRSWGKSHTFVYVLDSSSDINVIVFNTESLSTEHVRLQYTIKDWLNIYCAPVEEL